MKKITLLVASILFVFVFASEFNLENQPFREQKVPFAKFGRASSRNVPSYEFIVPPTDLITTYYDYMPGSYNGTAIKVQPEVSHPGGMEAGGVYMAFHIRETSTANRREYFSYVYEDGTVDSAIPIGTANIWEGYGGLDIDPYTADPFVVWHQQSGSNFDVVMSYDLFHLMGVPNVWKEPFPVIDNPINANDEFLWPYVYIGNSPLGESYRRVYVVAGNSANHANFESPSENLYFGFADFTDADLANQSELDWTYFSIPLMDEWHNGAIWTRPFSAVAVSDDGKVAVMGYTVSDDEQYDHHMFVFLNENYGEGEFSYHSFDMGLDVANPQNEDGSYVFVDEDGNPYTDLIFSFFFSGHMNVIFTDNNSKLMFVDNLILQSEQENEAGETTLWPYETFTYAFEYDLENDEFHYRVLDGNINENAANPNYEWGKDEIYLPWDTDNDGEIDEYNEDGNVVMMNGWPIFFYATDRAFHDNNYKIVKDEESGWIAAVWQDGLKEKYANDGIEGFEDWATVPEIAICFSEDEGETWSDVLYLNSIDTPELADMIPEYVYPALEIGEESDVKLHLMFLDDNSFGSAATSPAYGLPNGGMMNYACLGITFSSAEENYVENSLIKSGNYPNPFRNSTKIRFSLANDESVKNAEITIYNLKGEKIKKFSNIRNQDSVLWNGKDDSGKKVPSGIYFYKIRTGPFTETKKMILMQ